MVSNRLDLPWDAPLFTAGAGEVLIFTAADGEPPETATAARSSATPAGSTSSRRCSELRTEHGVRALLCEGGPHLHGSSARAPASSTSSSSRSAPARRRRRTAARRGLAERPLELELLWLLEEDGELYARYGESSAERRLGRVGASSPAAASSPCGVGDHRPRSSPALLAAVQHPQGEDRAAEHARPAEADLDAEHALPASSRRRAGRAAAPPRRRSGRRRLRTGSPAPSRGRGRR